MLQRDTRAQIVIIQNGKFVLLKHIVKKENRSFWGVPGGGVEPGESEEEAAIREAREETHLEVELLPIKIETPIVSPQSIYKREVTMVGYPVGGTARLGDDPEEGMKEYYELLDIKWHDLYDDTDLDSITLEIVHNVRAELAKMAFVRRAGTIVYKVIDKKIYYLLISARISADTMVLPQGHVDPGESPAEAAQRETVEEAGVVCQLEKLLGFYVHKTQGYNWTEIYLATFVSQQPAEEEREVRWCTIDEVRQLTIPRESRLFIEEVHEELTSRIR